MNLSKLKQKLSEGDGHTLWRGERSDGGRETAMERRNGEEMELKASSHYEFETLLSPDFNRIS